MVSVYKAPSPRVVCHIRSLHIFSRCWHLGAGCGGWPRVAGLMHASAGQSRPSQMMVWPVSSVQCLHAGEQWWSPGHNITCDDDPSVVRPSHHHDGWLKKTREFGCQALICEATWEWPHVSWALLSVLARQVSPGQEPLTYIFTFLSWSPALKFWDNRQSETRWQDTGIQHTTGHAPPNLRQWEVNNDNPGIFKRPCFFICNEAALEMQIDDRVVTKPGVHILM